MNLREIIKKHLEDNGFDGLCGEGCGCQTSELFWCEHPNMDDCQPGYKITCPGEDKCLISEDCPAPESGLWCMSTKKQSKDATNAKE
jgi:hypothetical protein